ncbi:IS200/IS605 family transposase [Candidatus Peregrinibacteria bacterium CG_4_9_14_0_8_um_filter_44_15]|nr:MAG: IS200/IS605 family transposase [Candidatus Peregrinibacteria bacterium CG_4_9_14_0_8_um_filter_44_15]
MKLRRQAHTVYKTQYHVVFVTKYRRKILVKGVCQWLELRFQEIRKYKPDLEFVEIGMDKDHVHLHMVIPPKYSVSEIINQIKSNTSRDMKEKFEFLEKVYWRTDSVWSRGFFVSTVGINEEVIRRYVQMQGEEDSGQAQLEL